MPEGDVVAQTELPHTRPGLVADLRSLGLEAGMTVLVHSSLSALGWVVGGPVTVVQALMDVLTPEGTLVMPTHSSDNSEPSHWRNPPVPARWWPIIRAEMPAYDPAISPARGMGRIADTFRSWPGVRRSAHPADSFAAWGREAPAIVGRHELAYSLGEGSPLARLYDADGWVLLLGVGHGNNTSLHLAEYRVAHRRETTNGAAWIENGRRVWREYPDLDLNADVFPALGNAFDQTGQTRIGQVGSADARLFRQRPAVDFAVTWLTARHASGQEAD
ncbi:MAG TPA: AAC(3) family N-acetyltransferase [Chloroflexota bacterium]|nr:AAC(3) family N-acetyltransferase [Chloroflexota bacterium]